ncbi:N-alpha-acetyltransferase 30 [Hypoxylon texense]
MDSSAKRKRPPTNESNDRHVKKNRGGNAGRWQTPHHKAKLEAIASKGLEVGDMGIWTTCVKGKERQALEELENICKEYGEKLYGIEREGSAGPDEEEDDDIEASIQKEVESMKPTAKPKDATFQPMRLELDCLLFMKTKSPVDPVKMVQEICRDAKKITDKQQRKSRFINRFTPVTASAKSNETGVEEVARKVLAEHFQLAGDEDKQPTAPESDACSYAIRPTFRAHNTLKRDDVIKKVASLIAPRHKVNLTSPDKVILIDIFQTFCGMSVVDGEWEALKRYNLHEIYLSALKGPKDHEEKPKDEAAHPVTKSEEA